MSINWQCTLLGHVLKHNYCLKIDHLHLYCVRSGQRKGIDVKSEACKRLLILHKKKLGKMFGYAIETNYVCPNYKKLMKNYPKIKNNVTILQKKLINIILLMIFS